MRAAPPLANEQEAYQYVIVAIRSSAYRMFSRRGRRRQLSGDVVDENVSSDALHQVLTVEERDQKKRMTTTALAVVSRLAPLHRQVIELLVLREPPMKLREVAEIQDAPISTVYSRLQAALGSLAVDLSAEFE